MISRTTACGLVAIGVLSAGVVQAAPQACLLEPTTLTPSTPDPMDEYGFSVGLSGKTAVVGAPFFGTGFVHVYERDGGRWTRQALLSPSTSNHMGYVVALEGDTIVTGNGGEMWVFERSGADWAETRFLGYSAGTDGVGHSIAISDDTFIAGGPFYQSDQRGAAYVYRRVGGTWQREARLVASDAEPNAYFGWWVDLEGDTAVVGAAVGQSGVAKAYVFTRQGSAWTERAILEPGDPPQARFGTRVALSGNTIAVGSTHGDGGPGAAGAVYVFTGSGANWTQQAKLQPLDSSPSDGFGAGLELDGDRLAAGALGNQNPQGGNGSVYLFERENGSWEERAQLTSVDGATSVAFGWAIDIEDDTYLVADSRSFGGISGSAYIYEALPNPAVYCTAKVNSCGSTPAIGFDGLPSASASSGFFVRASDVRADRPGVLLYGGTGPAALPFEGGFLCVDPGPLRRTSARSSGGTAGACDGVLKIDMNAFASGNAGGQPAAFLREPGAQVNGQWWGRDTLAHGGTLSDGLEYRVCP